MCEADVGRSKSSSMLYYVKTKKYHFFFVFISSYLLGLWYLVLYFSIIIITRIYVFFRVEHRVWRHHMKQKFKKKKRKK